MKYAKMLGLAVVAAAALTAFAGAGTASAGTVLCSTSPATPAACPEANMYKTGQKIKATLKIGTIARLKAGFGNVECKESEVAGKTSNTGSGTETVEGPIETLTFTTCGTGKVTVEKPGKLVVASTTTAPSETMGGNLNAIGFKVKVEQSGVTCVYAGNITSKLMLYASGEAGTEENMALVSAEEAEVPLEAGSEFLCGGAGKWKAEYTVSEPAPLFVTSS
jgi:hypothetical protein